MEALAGAVRQLAEDPDHRDWSLLKGYVRLTEHLPPSTFDAICVLGESTEAAAMAALEVPEGDPERFAVLWRALHSLPFCWLAVPREVWHGVVVRWLTTRLRTIEAAQLPDVDPAQMVNLYAYEPARRMLAAEERMPWLAPVLEAARAEALGIKCGADTLALRRAPVREFALSQYWDAIGRLSPAPMGQADPVPRTHQLFRHEHVLIDPELQRLRVDRARQRGLVSEARAAYLSAPAIGAVCAATGRTLDHDAQVELRNAHDHDPSWFADAYHWAYLYVLGGRA